MPRPKPSSPVRLERIPLSPGDCKRIALHLGHEELPALCADELGECLACHLKAVRADGERQNKSTAGNVEAAIVKAWRAVEELAALDTGIDANTRRSLKPTADAFISAAQSRIAELQGVPRIYPHQEMLRQTCAFLRLIFEKHVQAGFNTRGNLRRFAFEVLGTVDIDKPSIDEAHLDRLDEFLDAPPHPLDVPNPVR